ncbi:MAG: hypothetical protein HZB68_03965 [Candidatus Aenigmarchaeota archaeon]|nr:hypothetical protein [Candidatus Aenigmarchaeota archaeon]
MDGSIGDIASKSKEFLNKKVSLSGFDSQPTVGPKVMWEKQWFMLKDQSGEILCLADKKSVGKGTISGFVRREAGIPYIEA